MMSALQNWKAVWAKPVGFRTFKEASDGTCLFKRTQDYSYFENTDVSCIAAASVSLPDGAIITGGGCLLYDNVATSSIELALTRADLSTVPDIITIFDSSQPTTDEPILAQAIDLFLNGAASAVVDNLHYTYSINVIFDTTGLTAHQDLRLHTCTVTYTLVD
jgi:hypothetical protein